MRQPKVSEPAKRVDTQLLDNCSKWDYAVGLANILILISAYSLPWITAKLCSGSAAGSCDHPRAQLIAEETYGIFDIPLASPLLLLGFILGLFGFIFAIRGRILLAGVFYLTAGSIYLFITKIVGDYYSDVVEDLPPSWNTSSGYSYNWEAQQELGVTICGIFGGIFLVIGAIKLIGQLPPLWYMEWQESLDHWKSPQLIQKELEIPENNSLTKKDSKLLI
ncbi:MAG: hypothetical protein ACFFB3_14385 [Candidatus Hodarchaeota archaeon]